MKPAIVLLSAFILMFALIMMVRRRARTNNRRLREFSQEASQVITDAGMDNWSSKHLSADLGVADLWKMRRNASALVVEADDFRELSITWADVAVQEHVSNLHWWLQGVKSFLTSELCISLFEIVFGRIHPNTNYLHTRAAAGLYCQVVDIVGTMADLVDEESAVRLRSHLL